MRSGAKWNWMSIMESVRMLFIYWFGLWPQHIAYLHASLVPGIHGRRKEHLVSAVCAYAKFSQKSGKPCYFGILPYNSHLQWQWQQVLISLGLMHSLHRRRIQCLEAMDEWPCGDCFTFYSVMLCDEYGYVTMQNNGAMKIVNFTHAQMAETRHSFLRPWTPGTRLTCTYASVSNYLWCDLEYFQQQLITRFLQPVVQPAQTIVVVTGLLQGCIWL